MTARSDTRRLVLGALLLSASVLAPVGRRLGELLLVFGAAVFAGALSSHPLQSVEPVGPSPAGRKVWRAVGVRRPGWRTLVAIAVCGVAMILVAQHTVLRHGRMTADERTLASPDPTVNGGRAVGGTRVVGLHMVAVGEPFTLLGAKILVGAIAVCRHGGGTVVSVPVNLSAATAHKTMGTPVFQLLDSHGTPHDPSVVLTPGRARGSATHAAPPPRVFHEVADFDVPASSTRSLSLDVQSGSGSGVIDRVRFIGRVGSDLRGSAGQATCAQPGGAA